MNCSGGISPSFGASTYRSTRGPLSETASWGAWLASGGRVVIGGVAASALHGAEWVDADVPIELIARIRPQRGLIIRKEILADERMCIGRLPVTTLARTAFDLGRHLPRGEALVHLDALMRAAPFSVEDVLLLTKRYPGARGMRQLRELLPLVDGGAISPQETRLRLLFIDAGLPKPTTQIPVVDERGCHVRTHSIWVGRTSWSPPNTTGSNRAQYVKDLHVLPKLERLGWNVVRVIKEHYDDGIIDRAYQAMVSRGWAGRLRRK